MRVDICTYTLSTVLLLIVVWYGRYSQFNLEKLECSKDSMVFKMSKKDIFQRTGFSVSTIVEVRLKFYKYGTLENINTNMYANI